MVNGGRNGRPAGPADSGGSLLNGGGVVGLVQGIAGAPPGEEQERGPDDADDKNDHP